MITDPDARRDVLEALELMPTGDVPVSAARRRYLESLGTGLLVDQCYSLLDHMATARQRVGEARDRLGVAAELVAWREADAVGSEGFRECKNDASRKAFLVLQRRDSPAYAEALAIETAARRELDAAEAVTEAADREYRLHLAELRLAAGHLAFMAGH